MTSPIVITKDMAKGMILIDDECVGKIIKRKDKRKYQDSGA
jgi:hypothetical protein